MVQEPFLEFIENFLATECESGFDAQAITVSNSLTEEKLNLFSSHLNEMDRTRHHEMVVRDIYSRGLEDLDQEVCIDRPYSAMFTHPYNGLKTHSLNELKKQLLFFNRIAVIVPELAISSHIKPYQASKQVNDNPLRTIFVIS